MERRKTYRTLSASCCALAAAAALAACGGVSSSASSSKSTNNSSSSSKAGTPASAGNGAVLTVESSQQNAVTQNFNPFVQTSASTLLGATSLLYEPLLQANTLKPGMYYPWLATGYKWSDGGKAITFTIRPGVKWSDGTPLTPADVAFTYELIKHHPDANTTGLAVKDVSSSGNNVTITFASPQYTNLQNIAGQVYIVPQSVWSKVGDPGKYTDANPVGSGPYKLATFTGQGFTLGANPHYWGGQPPVAKVQFPTYASANAALSALQTDQLEWGGNFIPGVQQVFVSGNANHHVWFPPVQTNSLEPNLEKFPTNQLPVRKAISLAIDRTALSEQAEGGLEPPVGNASGLTLPVFQQYLSPDVASSTLPAHPDVAAAKNVLKQAGYVMGSDGMFRTKGGQKLTINITNPSSFADYATGDELVAAAAARCRTRCQLRGPERRRLVLGHRHRQLPAHAALVADERGALPALQRLAQQRPGDQQRRRRLRAPQKPAGRPDARQTGRRQHRRQPADRPGPDREVRGGQPPDHPHRLRRGVRRVQHRQVLGLAH